MCERAVARHNLGVSTPRMALHKAQKTKFSRDLMDNFREALQESCTEVDTQDCDWERRRTPGHPSTKDIMQKTNPPRRTRSNKARDAVPRGQDSIARGFQNLQLAHVPAAQPAPAVRAERS